MLDIKWDDQIGALWHENMNYAVHGVKRNLMKKGMFMLNI
jgi:hypothetical protein